MISKQLREFAEVKGGKRLPKGKNLTSVPTAHPYIRVRDVGTEKVLELTPDYEYVDNETQKLISRYIVHQGDIIISIVGTIGLVAKVGKSLDGANLTENCAKLVNINGLDRDFLYYYLASVDGQNAIKAATVGAVQAKLPLKNIQALPIPSLPWEVQRGIADILSALDDKIANNTKINHHLEQMAAAIFKSWFVNLEPTKSFTEVVQVLGGGTPKTGTEEYWNGDIPFFTPKDALGIYTLTTEKTLTEAGLFNCNSRLYPINTVFVTARGTVGKLALAGRPMAMNQSCYALIGNNGFGQHYVYHLAQYVIESLKHKASGAVFDAIVTRDFDSELVPDLTVEDASLFEEKVAPIYEAILNNSNENIRLSQLRDSLLPRLMSGDFSVADFKDAK